MSSLCLAQKSANSSWFGNGSLPLHFILLGISAETAEEVSGNDVRVNPLLFIVFVMIRGWLFL